MFIVPSGGSTNRAGSPASETGPVVTAIEHKMGLAGSATCELTLGGDIPCRGLLVGDVHQGIRQMFMVIEQARMCIGMKSLSHLSAAYLNALAYAKRAGAGSGPSADYGQGLASCPDHQTSRCSAYVDEFKVPCRGYASAGPLCRIHSRRVALAGGAHSVEGKKIDRRSDLLLPLIKGIIPRRSTNFLGQALQVFGIRVTAKTIPSNSTFGSKNRLPL